MAFSGAGVFSRIHNWISDRDNGIKITAVRHDAEDDGFATGLSNTICRDGQSTITAAIPFNAQRLTGLGTATADADALNRITADGRYRVHGQCYLAWASTSFITLIPYDGNQITIGGVRQTIPAIGVSLSSTGTVAGDVYYIYAYMSGTTMTLEFSATGPAVEAATGVSIKTGDASRTYVGRAATGTNTWIAESVSVISVLSHFNRRRRTVVVSGVGVTSSTSYVTANSFSILSDTVHPVRVNVGGYGFTQVAAGVMSGVISRAGVQISQESIFHSQAVDTYHAFSVETFVSSSGYYEYEFQAHVSAGTGTWNYTFHGETWG